MSLLTSSSPSLSRLIVTTKILLPRGFHWEAKKQVSEQQKAHQKGLDSRGLDLAEALAALRKQSVKGFDEIINVTFGTTQKEGVPIKGRIALPHGMGRKARVVAFTSANRVKEALEAGAFEAGDQNLVDQIVHGHPIHLYDAAVATPDMVPALSKIFSFLGTHGLSPSEKRGTVTEDLASAIKFHSQSFQYKTDLSHAIHGSIGKLSHSDAHLKENLVAFLKNVKERRPNHSTNKSMAFHSVELY